MATDPERFFEKRNTIVSRPLNKESNAFVEHNIKYVEMWTGLDFTPAEFRLLCDEFNMQKEYKTGWGTPEREEFMDGLAKKFAGRESWPLNGGKSDSTFPMALVAGYKKWLTDWQQEVAANADVGDTETAVARGLTHRLSLRFGGNACKPEFFAGIEAARRRSAELRNNGYHVTQRRISHADE